jgi:hypothetical protein
MKGMMKLQKQTVNNYAEVVDCVLRNAQQKYGSEVCE